MEDVTAGLSRFSRLAVLGTVSSDAYRGDVGKAAQDSGWTTRSAAACGAWAIGFGCPCSWSRRARD